jgi:hypothetical protein
MTVLRSDFHDQETHVCTSVLGTPFSLCGFFFTAETEATLPVQQLLPLLPLLPLQQQPVHLYPASPHPRTKNTTLVEMHS